MKKDEFIDRIESGEMKGLPETDEQWEWFNEWFDSQPDFPEFKKSLNEMNGRQAAEYMCMKIFARTFIEENGCGIYFATVEPRKIIISKKMGKQFENSPKLIIEL